MVEKLQTGQKKYEKIINDVLNLTSNFAHNTIDECGDYVYSPVKCPYCSDNMLIGNYFVDDGYKFGFICPSCHYMHKRDSILGFWCNNNADELLNVLETIDSLTTSSNNETDETDNVLNGSLRIDIEPETENDYKVLYDDTVDNKYYSLLKVVRLLDARISSVFNSDNSVKCPYCGCTMRERYYFNIKSFHVNLECHNNLCGYGFSAFSVDELRNHLKEIDSIRVNELMYKPEELPF